MQQATGSDELEMKLPRLAFKTSAIYPANEMLSESR